MKRHLRHAICCAISKARPLLIIFVGLAAGIALANRPVAAAGGPAPSVGTVAMPAGMPGASVQVTNFRCHITPAASASGQLASATEFPDCDPRSNQASGPRLAQPPCIGGCGQLNYNNGQVIASSTQFYVFLNCPHTCFSDWGNPYGFIVDYFDSGFIHVLDQYMVNLFVPTASNKYSSHSNGCQVTPSAPHVMSDSDVHNYIMACINQYYNPNGGGGGYNQMYTFFLPPGQDLCMGSPASCYCPDNSSQCTSTTGHGLDFCGYHASFDATDATNSTIHVIYQAMPYDDVVDSQTGYYCHITNGPNGSQIDSENNILAHELAETITDPDVGQGWVRNSDGSEIGDICNFMEQNPIYLHADAYSIQTLYSNKAQNCLGAYRTRGLTHDFNFDMDSDLLWRNANGTLAAWLMNGGAVLQSAGLGSVTSAFSIIGQHDFNGDGKDDILWRDSSGNVSMWFMNGAAVSSATPVGNLTSNWTLYGSSDLNGDGKGDLLWRDSNTGTVAVWFMNGAAVASTANLGAVSNTWTILGDFNGGILWRDTSGDIAVWNVQNGQITSSVGLGRVTSNFVVQGGGDFNGDGYIDILWRDTNTGALSIWFTTGGPVTSAANVGTLSSNWSVAQIGDYNSDGKSDIMLLDSAGDVAVWLMDGSTVSSSLGISNVAPTWLVQNLNAN